MIVCIVTVYDSINCGSFWQAYALGNIIQSQGCKVVYWKRDKRGGASSSTYFKVKKTIKYIIKYGVNCGLKYYMSLKKFKTLQKSFEIIDSNQNADCFILGSDTIWNLDSHYFNLHYKTYWGI